jgi:hypothetical protein
MRLVGKAYYANDGSDFGNRGGIIAHQVGYGKTVVIIALLELQRTYDDAPSKEKRQEIADRVWGHRDAFIHLKATLIIVPDHITTQWETEFVKFGSPGLKILAIKNYAQFAKPGLLEKMEAADVIIVSTSMWSGPYETARRSFGVLRETQGGQSDREKGSRYLDLCKRLRPVVAQYHANFPEKGQAARVRQADRAARQIIDQAQRDYWNQKQKFTLSSRRKGNKKRKGPTGAVVPVEVGSASDDDGAEEPDEEPEDDLSHKKSEVSGKASWSPTMFLENFSFARVVLDEFSYSTKPDVFPFFANAFSLGKWLLSGTPRLGNLAEVSELARCLQVHVARPDPCVRADLDPITRGPVLSPTAPGERIRLHAATLRSCNFAAGRHLAAENFVRAFVRADKTDRAGLGLQVDERVIPIPLSLLSRLIYHGAEYELSLASGNVFYLPGEVRHALDTQAKGKASEGKALGERLLLELATRQISGAMAAEVRGTTHRIVSLNTAQAKSLCDKLLWLARRSDRGTHLVPKGSLGDHKQRLALVQELMREEFVATHRRCLSGQMPLAGYGCFGGKAYGLELLSALYPPPAKAPAGNDPTAWWTGFRGNGARFFWPDWFVLDEAWVEKDADEAELAELALEAVLFARTHPDGQAITANKQDWLMKHVPVVKTVMRASMTGDVLSGRLAPTADEPTTVAVGAMVVDHTMSELVAFLKACHSAREECTDASPARAKLASLTSKPDLQSLCEEYSIKYSDNEGPGALKKKLESHFSGSARASAYTDGRAFHIRSAFPVPGRMIKPEKGSNVEMVLEEMTSTIQQQDSCQQDLREACRRRNLYRMINGDGEVELPVLEHDQQDKQGNPTCQHCSKGLTSSAGWAGFVVVACGHWLCAGCNSGIESDASAVCPVVDCGAFCRMSPIIPIAKSDFELPARRDPEGKKKKEGTSQKLDYLIQEVTQIIERGQDRTIIFCAVEKVAKLIDDLLRAEGVTTLSLIGSKSRSAAVIEAFKMGVVRVLLLDPTSDHAAGSNLTVANHIFFVSPAVEQDPHTRNMHHQQGIGRCLRQGQLKTVFIYNLMTENTLDERLLRGLAEERASEEVVVGATDPIVRFFATAPPPWWLLETTTASTVAAASVPGTSNGVSQSLPSSSAADGAGSVPSTAPATIFSTQRTAPTSTQTTAPPASSPWPVRTHWSNKIDPNDPMDDLYD